MYSFIAWYNVQALSELYVKVLNVMCLEKFCKINWICSKWLKMLDSSLEVVIQECIFLFVDFLNHICTADLLQHQAIIRRQIHIHKDKSRALIYSEHLK